MTHRPLIRRYSTALAALLLLTVTLILHGTTLNAWWRGDDPFLLTHLLKYNTWENYYDPAVARAHNAGFLTPWYFTSFSIDKALFGLNPRMFYMHNIFSIWIISLMLFFLLKIWMPVRYALVPSIIFLVGCPTAEVVQAIMTRHYIEGLIFTLGGFYLLSASIWKQNRESSLIAGLCWAFAFCSKEVFLPLPMIFLLFPVGTFRERVRALFPTICILFLYPLWRYYMLGQFTGGYVGWQGSFSFHNVVKVLLLFPSMLFGPGIAAFTGGICVLFFISMAVIRYRRLLPVIAAGFAVIIIPLIPLMGSDAMGFAGLVFYRYFFLLWFFISVIAGIGFSHAMTATAKYTRGVAIVCLLSFLVLSANKTFMERQYGTVEKIQDTERIYRYWYESPSNTAFYIGSYARPYFLSMYQPMAEFRRLTGKKGEMPRLLSTERELQEYDCSKNPLVTYDFKQRSIRDLCRRATP